MKQEQQPRDLTYDDLMTGIPEDFAVKYQEVIVILLSQMLEMTKDEGEWFIRVWSRLLIPLSFQNGTNPWPVS